MRRSKVVQIIPSTGWMLRFKEEDGKITTTRSVCIALLEDGEVHFMDADNLGVIDICDDIENFVGVFYVS